MLNHLAMEISEKLRVADTLRKTNIVIKFRRGSQEGAIYNNITITIWFLKDDPDIEIKLGFILSF